MSKPISLNQLADDTAAILWKDMARVGGFDWSDTAASAYIETALWKAYEAGIADQKLLQKRKAKTRRGETS